MCGILPYIVIFLIVLSFWWVYLRFFFKKPTIDISSWVVGDHLFGPNPNSGTREYLLVVALPMDITHKHPDNICLCIPCDIQQHGLDRPTAPADWIKRLAGSYPEKLVECRITKEYENISLGKRQAAKEGELLLEKYNFLRNPK